MRLRTRNGWSRVGPVDEFQKDRHGMGPVFFSGSVPSNFLNFRDIPDPFSLYLMFHIWDPVQGLGSMEYVGLENITFALEDP